MRARTEPVEGTVVAFKLSKEGGRKFRTETGKHMGDYMAIVLDDRVMAPPVIQGAIGRTADHDGARTLAGAQDLALVLRAGALPVPLKVGEVRTSARPSARTRSTTASRRRHRGRARRDHHARRTTASREFSRYAA